MQNSNLHSKILSKIYQNVSTCQGTIACHAGTINNKKITSHRHHSSKSQKVICLKSSLNAPAHIIGYAYKKEALLSIRSHFEASTVMWMTRQERHHETHHGRIGAISRRFPLDGLSDGMVFNERRRQSNRSRIDTCHT